ncbi:MULTISPECIES: 7-carboxy-7-deazaguanine synthase [unclassified Halomonas]|uniref:7-carboxy-7-deazaguanine synthase n=1 Tax=unclassified Halomonas TaxID=2609666 RepID=UPI0028860104|nr:MULTISPECIES: 7-carboxy-7-deazaguanine synthase [unclassified Halomonas]MDT0499623.1 7-carboxy-7-deazaguanine synthase [Halomonas sp. PAR7]MDT0510560.1 7-carboxy-7-deazaguanine synthase [Halomonas sp. LES1]MDT0592641.1 7-carboxy-7-deazaguanine synthase [Halomonas sp. PAR8]
MYQVKEAFYSLQGEGGQAGRASVFCRFSGCNLWSGREEDRARAVCRFCDTDFVGTDGQNGGRFASASALADHLVALWPDAPGTATPQVIFTGGEPLLQLDAPLIAAMHARNFDVAVETNGTLPAPPGIDWLCVSPKGTAPLVQASGDELKLVYPQAEALPEQFVDLDFRHFFLQPMDTAPRGVVGDTLSETVAYCLANPQWRLSLQTHKIAGID